MNEIKLETEKKLSELRTHLEKADFERVIKRNVCIYACGSLGRLEMTQTSDLDLFFIVMSESTIEQKEINSNLRKYLFFSKIYEINKKLRYQDPSNLGEYWDFISKKNLLDIGSRQEDYNNSFTARMLLMLESKPVFNEPAYNTLVDEIIHKSYFKDYDDHRENFYPLFLINDIMRYWYTLTLNYEYRRNNNYSKYKKYWKRLKLKYARLITCYSMIACLYKKNITPEYVIECIKKTPFERFEMVSVNIDDGKEIINKIINEYKWFVSLREHKLDWWASETNKELAFGHADEFHELVIHQLMTNVSKTNPELRKRMDIYQEYSLL